MLFARGPLFVSFAKAGPLFVSFAKAGTMFAFFATGPLFMLFARGPLFVSFAKAGTLFVFFATGSLFISFAKAGPLFALWAKAGPLFVSFAKAGPLFALFAEAGPLLVSFAKAGTLFVFFATGSLFVSYAKAGPPLSLLTAGAPLPVPTRRGPASAITANVTVILEKFDAAAAFEPAPPAPTPANLPPGCPSPPLWSFRASFLPFPQTCKDGSGGINVEAMSMGTYRRFRDVVLPSRRLTTTLMFLVAPALIVFFPADCRRAGAAPLVVATSAGMAPSEWECSESAPPVLWNMLPRSLRIAC